MLSIKKFTFSPIQENTYVLYNEKLQGIIIDPGCYFDEEREQLKLFIEQNKIELVLLLNTHCHLDHVFGNKFVAETWGLTLCIHEKEKKVLEGAPASGLMFNMPFDNYTGELIFLEVGETILLGDDKLKILFTPGHSPGSICFYSESQSFAISGDVLFQGSIGRTDLPGGDYDTLINSIRNQLFTLEGDVIIHPGHGADTSTLKEKRTNPFLT